MSAAGARRRRKDQARAKLHAVEPLGEDVPELTPPEGTRQEPAAILARIDSALNLTTFVAGAVIIAYFAPQFPFSSPWHLKALILLCLLAVTADRLSLPAYGEGKLSISFVAMFAAAVLFGPEGAAIVGPLTALSVYGWRDTFSSRSRFNIGTAALAGVLGAITYRSIAGSGQADITLEMVPAALGGAAVAYAVNMVLVCESLSVATRRTPWAVWREKGQWFFPHYLVFGLLGLALALAYRALGITGFFVFMAPPAMMQLAIRQYIGRTTRGVTALQRKNVELERANADILAMTDRLRQAYHGTLEALVSALDARDRETKGHSSRVTNYTLEMARRIGIKENSPEWLDIQRGALLHDVGKIGVSDNILHKPGSLTDEEWTHMRRHPAIGYNMLKEITFLSRASEIVHAHHERYDGKGYPRGLKGQEIPLGARIFAVADTFDAMTSDRPYRKAMSWQEARDEIARNSGTQFDPQVVKLFLQLLAEWAAKGEIAEKRLAA